MNEKIGILSLNMMVILDEYIDVDNDLFKSSARRAIPGPWFEPIDFESHCRKLNKLLLQLESAGRFVAETNKTELSSDEEFFTVLLIGNYVALLASAIRKLYDICFKLYQKAETIGMRYSLLGY